MCAVGTGSLNIVRSEWEPFASTIRFGLTNADLGRLKFEPVPLNAVRTECAQWELVRHRLRHCAKLEWVRHVQVMKQFTMCRPGMGSPSARPRFGPSGSAGSARQRKEPTPSGWAQRLGFGLGWAPLGHPLRGTPWALGLGLGLGYGLYNLGLCCLWAKGKAHALGHGPQLGQATGQQCLHCCNLCNLG